MKTILFFIITLSATLTHHQKAGAFFVIWNVGQGQWATAITNQHCLHFDIGGEFFPLKKVKERCDQKENFIFLSHWDWDHIGGLQKLKKQKWADDFCIAILPQGPSSKRKMNLVHSFKKCPHQRWQNLLATWSPPIGGSSNELSHVIFFQGVLLPGDSPLRQEKIWSLQRWVHKTKILLLGHHGSKTSTSDELIRKTPQLKLTISSARWARYKHPHSSIEIRLRKAQVPLLRTEDWGNIWLEQTY